LERFVLKPLADYLASLGWIGHVLSATAGLILSLLSLVFCCGTEVLTALVTPAPTRQDIERAENELRQRKLLDEKAVEGVVRGDREKGSRKRR
jgi:hypothetical protein